MNFTTKRARLCGIVLSVFVVSFVPKSFAQDIAVSGKITSIHVVKNGENFGYRVYIENKPACGADSPTWAYINKSASNYEAIIATLTTLHISNRSVTLLTTKVNGYCEINYLMT